MLSADRDVVQILKFSVCIFSSWLYVNVSEWSDHDESQMVAAVDDYEKQLQEQQREQLGM